MAITPDTPPSSQPSKIQEDLWDPSNLLQIAYDRLPASELSCVGRIHHGIRCRWDIKEPQRSEVFAALVNLGRQSPEAVRDEQLVALAASLLCKFHGNQVDEVLRRWKDVVNRAARQHVSIGEYKVKLIVEAHSVGLDELLSQTASRMENLAVIRAFGQTVHHQSVDREAILERIETALQQLENNITGPEKSLADEKALSTDEQPILDALGIGEKEDKSVHSSATGSNAIVSSPLTMWSDPAGNVGSVREQALALQCQQLETELARTKQQLIDSQNGSPATNATILNAPGAEKQQQQQQQQDVASNDVILAFTQTDRQLDTGNVKCTESTRSQNEEMRGIVAEAKIDHQHTGNISNEIRSEYVQKRERRHENRLVEAQKDDTRSIEEKGDCLVKMNYEKPSQRPEKFKDELEIITLPIASDGLQEHMQTLQAENNELKESIKACWLHRICTFTYRRRNKFKALSTVSEKGRRRA